MMRLYACLGSGNCYKPWLAMNQLGLQFEINLVDVLVGEQQSPEYLKVNPMGVVPYLVTEAGKGLGESNAVLWYIAEDTFLMPQSPEARAEALQWMFYEQAKLEPYISPARFFTTILPDQKTARADDIARWQAGAVPGLRGLNTHLADRPFILGDAYSVADIAIFGYVHTMEEAGLSVVDYPNIDRWIKDVGKTRNFRPLSDLRSPTSQAA